ncbi:E3 ubiquitin-protein ligase NRDP1-like [Montipora foliosa]|uniref:E3 ubiquitin-protein ligase NRDP1-like n=1 Tax=Montipora foliosa TaxID=591990 RepID=UPI0035F1D499
MGYCTKVFISRVDHNLICVICSGVFEKPVATQCGHTYCKECLDHWLRALSNGNVTLTCPECHRKVSRSNVAPVLALNGFIESLLVECEYSTNGCPAVLKLGDLESHMKDCEYSLLKCSKCNGMIVQSDIRLHQAKCAKINDQDLLQSCVHTEIDILKEELAKAKKALEVSEETVRRLQRSLRELRVRTQIRSSQLADDFDPAWDPDYGYGYSPRSVVQLSGFISRFLNGRPGYVDREKIFSCLKRCFDYFHNCAAFWQDLHMLLATAVASHWFTDTQQENMTSWLKIIAREKLLN